jgi:putative ABC transport system permease protein
MIFNNVKIAYRNIGKHKLFTGINMFGLAMSMSLGFLIVTLIGDNQH